MALFWRIWVAVSMVNIVVLAVFLGLASLQFASINSALVGERLVVLANRTVAPFAASVRLGLPLSGVRNAPVLLERARQTDEDIIALHVFDAEGHIVHSTARPVPSEIPAAAAAARRSAKGAPWHRESPDGFIGGVDVAGADGKSAGGILIVYPRRGDDTQVRSMITELLGGAFWALVVASVLGTLILRLSLGEAMRHFSAIDAAHNDFEVGAWRRGTGPEKTVAPDRDPSGLTAQLESAAARYRAVGQDMAAAEDKSR